MRPDISYIVNSLLPSFYSGFARQIKLAVHRLFRARKTHSYRSLL